MSKKKEKQNTTHDRNSALTTYIRIGIIALAILLQLGIMMFTTYFLRANAAPLYVALDILAMVTVFSLINRHDSSAYRLAWIVVVLMTPIVGMALYWLWGRVDFNKKDKGALNTAFEKLLDDLFQDTAWDVSSDISVLETMLASDGIRLQSAPDATAPEKKEEEQAHV